MSRRLILGVAAGLLAAAAAAGAWFALRPQPAPVSPYRPPAGAVTTDFPAPGPSPRRLTIEAATDVSFTRPFILEFQRRNPNVAVRYVDFISGELFRHAQAECQGLRGAADLYLTVSTDHLVRLANDGCAYQLPPGAVRDLPAWAQWRREVVAFSLEPAVFVYNTDLIPPGRAPRDHVQLIEMLRETPSWRGRIGTYDIEASGSGYLYAAVDARQSATYGRLIESFGRSQVRIYCCSNVMVDAVARQEIALAYNVQKSYAYAAERAGKPVGIVIPSDYQAVHTRSIMVAGKAANRRDAVAFAQFLTSAAGQEIAARQLSPLRSPAPLAGQAKAPTLIPAGAGPALLALGDQARRSQFIAEWKNAVRTRGGEGPAPVSPAPTAQ